MEQEYPNWQKLPEDERGRLLVLYLNDILRSEQSVALREELGLSQDEVLPAPPATPKDIHETAEYWHAVKKEAEDFWAKRYDPDAPEDW
jgi:hypothetical protein